MNKPQDDLTWNLYKTSCHVFFNLLFGEKTVEHLNFPSHLLIFHVRISLITTTPDPNSCYFWVVDMSGFNILSVTVVSCWWQLAVGCLFVIYFRSGLWVCSITTNLQEKTCSFKYLVRKRSWVVTERCFVQTTPLKPVIQPLNITLHYICSCHCSTPFCATEWRIHSKAGVTC